MELVWRVLMLVLRSRQWTPFELALLGAGVLVAAYLLLVLVRRGIERSRAYWRRRSIGRLLSQRSGYVDPCRIPRETDRALEGMAQRAARVPNGGATGGVDANCVEWTASVSAHAGPGRAEGTRYMGHVIPLVSAASPGAVAGERLDRDTDYGRGTRLVFPASLDPSQRVN